MARPADQSSAPADARVHRALASPARVALLERLRQADGPVGVDALADHLDLHVNTVRSHLGQLEQAGLVASESEARDRPGRPRLVYHATDRAATVASTTSDDGYRFLSVVLASYLSARSDDPAGEAEDAGTVWGHHLVDRPAPFRSTDVDDGIGQVVAALDGLGFAPELADADTPRPRILLRRCPFLEVARDHQDVVCSVHLGLIRGALDELGVDVEASELLPFVEPDLCVTRLEVG